MIAVEWFTEQLPIRIKNLFHKEIQEAKEMEKQMVIDMVEKSRATGLTAEYLLLTYGSKGSDKEEQKRLITEIMNEDDKNGLYNTSTQTEISDEEIEKEASKSAINYSTKRTYPEIRHLAYSNGFLEGIKWYREQLSQRK